MQDYDYYNYRRRNARRILRFLVLLAWGVFALIVSLATIIAIAPILHWFGLALLVLAILLAFALAFVHIWSKIDEVQGRRKERDVSLQIQLARMNRVQVGPHGAEGVFDLATGTILQPQILQPVPNSLHYAPHFPAMQGSSAFTAPNIISSDNASSAGNVSARNLAIPGHVDLLPRMQDLLKQGAINRKRLDLYLGESTDGPIILPLHDAMHTGLLGKSGAGKSAQQRSILTQLYLADPHGRKVTFNLFDLEGRELKLFQAVPNARFYTEDEHEAERKIEEYRERLEALCKLDDEEAVNLPYELLIIEELLDFRQSLSERGKENLDKLMRRGRKCHIYTMGASQLFQAAEVGRSIKQMMSSRFCFKTEAESAKAFGFKSDVLDVLTQPGRFAYDLPIGRGVAQAPFVSVAQVKELLPARGVTRPSINPAEAWQAPLPGNSVFGTARAASELYSESEQVVEPISQPTELEQAASLYNQGYSTTRALGEQLGCGKDKAARLINEARNAGLILEI